MNEYIGQFVAAVDADPDPQVGSALPNPAGREPVKILLIGSPAAIRLVIHRLHVLGFAEAIAWSILLPLSDDRIVFTPDPGDEVSLLVQYLAIE